MTKVNMEVIKPWITRRVTELLGFEDEVLINFIHSLLDAKVCLFNYWYSLIHDIIFIIAKVFDSSIFSFLLIGYFCGSCCICHL